MTVSIFLPEQSVSGASMKGEEVTGELSVAQTHGTVPLLGGQGEPLADTANEVSGCAEGITDCRALEALCATMRSQPSPMELRSCSPGWREGSASMEAAAEPDDPCPPLGCVWLKERTNACKFSSDLHLCTVACTHMRTRVRRKRERS